MPHFFVINIYFIVTASDSYIYLMYYFFLSTDNELYTGTVADFSGSNPIIYRKPLQTEQYDSLSLNGN